MEHILDYLKWRLFDNGKYTLWGKVENPRIWNSSSKASTKIKGKSESLKSWWNI